ncbi:MAG TPA: hypothetical protein VNF91_10685, partial [Candidatus Acidoferrum sp.]|nr:hypothetical protein [Candidatus Acidoferrum sp.]
VGGETGGTPTGNTLGSTVTTPSGNVLGATAISGSGVSLANTGAPIVGGVLGAVMALVGGIGLRIRRRR